MDRLQHEIAKGDGGNRDVARLAVGPVVTIAALVAVVQLGAASVGGYWFDEAYTLAIGRNHLDWGAADQPPLTSLLAHWADLIAPGSIFALRIPAVASTSIAVIVAALIARELGGDRRAQVITAGAQATTLWISFAGYWMTPYTLEPLQWLALVWLVVRWVRVRDDRLLWVAGLVCGLAIQTKFQVVLLGAALLAAVLINGPREMLRRPALWGGVVLAGALALPTLLWQFAHGWPQLQMSGVVSAEAEALGGSRALVAALLLVAAGVAGTVLAVVGTWYLLRAEALRPYRFLAITFVTLYVVFVVTAGRPYYLGGLYGALAAAGAVAFQHRRERRRARGRWMAWPGLVLSAVVALGAVALSAGAVTTESDTVGRSIASRTTAAWESLPPAERDRAALAAKSYISAAYLDVYASEYGLPAVYSGSRGYGYFDPPPNHADAVVYVSNDPDELCRHFTDITQLTPRGGDPREAGIWHCTGRTDSWNSIWETFRSLDVTE